MARTTQADEDGAATEVAATAILEGFDGSDDNGRNGSAHDVEAKGEEDAPPGATPDERAPLQVPAAAAYASWDRVRRRPGAREERARPPWDAGRSPCRRTGTTEPREAAAARVAAAGP